MAPPNAQTITPTRKKTAEQVDRRGLGYSIGSRESHEIPDRSADAPVIRWRAIAAGAGAMVAEFRRGATSATTLGGLIPRQHARSGAALEDDAIAGGIAPDDPCGPVGRLTDGSRSDRWAHGRGTR